MGRINRDLLSKLKSKLGISQSRVYALIDAKARESLLPPDLAAIALATSRGISVAKYADAEALSIIRGAIHGRSAPSVVVPAGPPVKGSPPARAVAPRRSSNAHARPVGPRRRGNTVFVVHGRNSTLRDAMFTFLRAIGLKPLEWNQAIRMTKQPSPYVGVILDTAFREAAAVVVLLTPDDVAKLKKKFLSRSDEAYEKKLTGQARPNVLFEAGMAFGRNPENTVLVQVGTIRPFSDVGGRHVVHMNDSAEKRTELVTKLANAGCNVDTTGTDWLKFGDFVD